MDYAGRVGGAGLGGNTLNRTNERGSASRGATSSIADASTVIDNDSATNSGLTGSRHETGDSGIDNGFNTGRHSSLGGQSLVDDELTTAQVIASTASASERLASAPGKIDSLEKSGGLLDRLKQDEQFEYTYYSNKDESVVVGRAKASYTAPDWDIDNEKGAFFANVGGSGELTAANFTNSVAVAELASAEVELTVATVAAESKAEVQGQFQGWKSSLSAEARLGAEALAYEASASAELEITPKTVGDALGGFYNDFIDPVVDVIAGRDMPEIPEVPQAWDHGIVVGGTVTAGVGLAFEQHYGLEIGEGKGVRVKAGGKTTVAPGLVVGGGVTFGFR